MEERKLNEKESLELIAQMIQNTRRNLDAGSGNMFLLWGYLGVVVTLLVLAAVYFTKSTAALWLFFMLPIIGWPLTFVLGKKWERMKGAKEYSDKMLSQIWQIMGIACMGTVLFAFLYHKMELILPLCAMLMSLASLLTGIIIRYTLFSGLPSCGFAWSLVLLFQVITEGASYSTLIIFAIIILVSMVIPGHVLNYRARKEVQ